ncbi:GTP-binding protein YPT6 [Tritrichomonas foetus]|uniref:GTP-binding protein YPT6 n=1 Tax=Tritrichomonas foetus TaxID=1144522 RepID=A0A1J4KKP2_9EUKA|nr:GTP-binding protein YPT6 [Tritrichomonas foetus]|eukprot:OHT11873.1 GTP-binding protein YPT6 [Tritrichomonas foetus]
MIMNKIKTVLIGDSGVGKTCIFQRLDNDSFKEEMTSTVGGSFCNITLQNDKGTYYEIGLWDTAGQERFRNIIPLYFQRATFVILMYDISSRDSFNGLKKWAEIIKDKGPENTQLFLVGNKSDLEKERAIPMSEGEKQAEEIGAVFFCELSAKTRIGLDILLKEITDRCEVLSSISFEVSALQGPSVKTGAEVLRKSECRC